MSSIIKSHPSYQSKKEKVVEKGDWATNPTDRCDRCSAQAYVKIEGVSGSLLFCGHHYNKIMNDPIGYKKMMSFMYKLTDDRDKLIENRLVGSEN